MHQCTVRVLYISRLFTFFQLAKIISISGEKPWERMKRYMYIVHMVFVPDKYRCSAQSRKGSGFIQIYRLCLGWCSVEHEDSDYFWDSAVQRFRRCSAEIQVIFGTVLYSDSVITTFKWTFSDHKYLNQYSIMKKYYVCRMWILIQ